MDNVTHALAGLLLAEAAITARESREARAPLLAPLLVTATFRRAAYITGVITAELPDADLLYAGSLTGGGKLGYLLHHRGHTHTVVVALLGALLVWGAALALRRTLRGRDDARWLLWLCLAGTLSHIALDWTNSYGVHPFWPVWNAWRYGDAVFIVEPWLWMASVPALLLAARSRGARVALGTALAVMLAAVWMVAMVSRGAAVALTLGAALALAACALVPRARRATFGLVAWLVVEVAFFAGSAVARGAIVASAYRADAYATVRDVVLTPEISNPFAWHASVVETAGGEYRVLAATATLGGGVRWGDRAFVAPRAELSALWRTNCVAAAALRFIRLPAWTRRDDASVRLSDLRYDGGGRGGFATIDAPARPARCPTHVPPWDPPRLDVIGPR